MLKKDWKRVEKGFKKAYASSGNLKADTNLKTKKVREKSFSKGKFSVNPNHIWRGVGQVEPCDVKGKVKF